jgi:hypothetical protein
MIQKIDKLKSNGEEVYKQTQQAKEKTISEHFNLHASVLNGQDKFLDAKILQQKVTSTYLFWNFFKMNCFFIY